MENVTLAAARRSKGTKGQLSAMRREGRVPGILYGMKSEPQMLEVKAADLRVILPKRNPVLDLRIDGQAVMAMVKQVERDPIRRDVRHVDFLRVDETHPVTVQVPVIPRGMPVGVKIEGGVFSISRKNVTLKAKVRDLPESFTVDISGLKTGDTVYVKDLKFDKGAVLTPGRTALFGVGLAKVEEEVAPAPAAAATPEGADKAAVPAAGDKATAAGGKDKAAAAASGKDKPPAAGGKDKAAPPAKGDGAKK